MQTPESNSLDPVASLFDVVISMPADASLDTIQILAENEAGLSAQRVERLISVLRNTPNAKVGTGLPRGLAEEEKQRFIKAGLHVEVTPAQPTETPITKAPIKSSFGSSVTFADDLESPELEQKSTVSKKGFFSGATGLLLGLVLAMAAGLFYMGQTGMTIGGVSMPWGKKATLPAVASAPASQAGTNGSAAADAVDDDDPLIQAARASSSAAAQAASTTGAIPKLTKQDLTLDFAVTLAEIGHLKRARAVLHAITDNVHPAADSQAAMAIRAAELKLQAWSAQRMERGQARQEADDLMAKTRGISNALERTQLQGQLAAILSRNPQLPADVPRMLLSLGAASQKTVDASQSDAALGDLLVSMASVSLNETTALARTGAWSKAKTSASQIEGLLNQAPNAWAKARLYALDYQAKLQTGQLDQGAKSLESALALTVKESDLQERAVWLRKIAQLSDASTQEQFENVANTLQNQLSAKSGMERARGLTELSLLYSAAGLPGKSGQLRTLAKATTGLSAADSLAIDTDLLVRGDLATAKLLHSLGRYSEAETVLMRVSGSLF